MKQKLIDQATQCAIDAFFNELSESWEFHFYQGDQSKKFTKQA